MRLSMAEQLAIGAVLGAALMLLAVLLGTVIG